MSKGRGLALCEPKPSAATMETFHLWKQPQLPCCWWSLALMWSQVQVCRAPGVVGLLPSQRWGKGPCAPSLTQLGWAAGLADLK